MSVADLQASTPRFTVSAIVGLLLVSLLYSVLVTTNVALWLAAWGGLFGVGIAVFVVALFYRLVVAVERIADSQ